MTLQHVRILLLVFIPATISSLSGQTSTGKILGTVTDPSGASVPSANIKVTNEVTGVSRETLSDASGLYQVLFLPAGRYSITVAAASFQETTYTGIGLDVQQSLKYDIVLQVSAVNQAVTVTAKPVLLNTENSTMGAVVTNRQVLELPLNNRNFNQLSLLSPGVVQNGSGGGSIGFGGQLGINLSVNGARSNESNYLIDGMSDWSQWFYSTSIDPSIDMIQEFKIQTATFSAEYGLGAGVVSVAFKSGTNSFHGAAFEYVKNPIMNARNFFSATVSPLKRNQYGGSIGGPIQKNRMFFFFGYEGVRQITAVQPARPVPSVPERNGIFANPIMDPFGSLPFPNNTIPTERLDSVALRTLAKLIPLPNSGPSFVTYSAGAPLNNKMYGTKIDRSFGTKDNLFFRYMWYNQSSQAVLGPAMTDYHNGYAAGHEAGGWTHTFTPTLVNELHFAHRREKLDQFNVVTAGQPGSGETINGVQYLGIKGMPDSTSSGWPYLYNSVYGQFGSYFVPAIIPFDTYQGSDTLVKILGKHSIKVGVDWSRLRQNTQIIYISGRGVYSYSGAFTGNGFADFMLGTPQYVYAYAAPPEAWIAYSDVAAFVQDDWKVRPNLTLNLGFRWSLQTPPVEKNDQLEGFNFGTGQVVVAGRDGKYPKGTNPVLIAANPNGFQTAASAGWPLRSLRYTNWRDFDPRFGFAWSPRPGMAVRGGYGISHAPLAAFALFSQSYSAPFTGPSWAVTDTAPKHTISPENPFNGIPQGTLGAVSTLASGTFYPPSQPNGYYQQMSLGLEKQVGQSNKFELYYVGSLGTHQIVSFPGANYPSPGPGNIQDRRPYPNVGAFSSANAVGRAHYHSLQATYTRRVSAGLSMTSAFTWAKNIDLDPSGYAGYETLNRSKGIAASNVAARWVSSYVYELPVGKGRHFLNHGGVLNQVLGGWTTTGVLSFQSGLPFGATILGDPANVGASSGPADRICNGSSSSPTLLRYFDVNCFVPPGDTWLPLAQRTNFHLGNSARNPLVGPGSKNWDAGIYKNFPIRENIRLQYRFEAFNFPNHANFGNPNTNITANTVLGKTTAELNPNVGRISSAASGRTLQMALRIEF